MNMEVHGTNTIHKRRLWQNSSESLRCFGKERTPSAGECLYGASQLLRLRYVALRWDLLPGEKVLMITSTLGDCPPNIN